MAQLVMPKLGLTMTEGLLSEWRVQEGDAFAVGDVLYVVETEKVANEIEAEAAGVVGQLLIEAGETVPVGTPIATLAGEQAASPVPPAGGGPAAKPPREETDASAAGPVVAQGQGEWQWPRKNGDRILATPLARRLARESSIDLGEITGSGPRGRIKAADVEAARSKRKQPVALREVATDALVAPMAGAREIVPDAIRLATVRRVTAAKRDIPHFYVMHEAEISSLMSLRQSLNDDAVRTKISVTHMLIKAFGVSLAEMPEANRIWLNDKIIAFDRADVGMVVEAPDGLRIPMVRDVGRKPLDQIASDAAALAQKAREGGLAPDDVGGGSASISNVGMFGASGVTPIINPPHAMILGVGGERQVFRPDASGEPKLCRELVFTLACDHRIHDGALAARFLNHFVSLIESPLRLLREARPAYEM
jgi:pyruvate dehydrogenase E2 component (dihydrolipoyllysine-residue acetyltransferase)